MFEWIREHLWETWLMAAVLLGIAEMLSLDLIFAMLAVGAGVGMIAALAGAPGVLTLVLALVSAVGLIAFLRPGLVGRLHSGPTLRIGADALIGKPVQVLSLLAPTQTGRVKIGGEEWTAAPYDELDEIEPGERAEVVEIRGATAYVRRA